MGKKRNYGGSEDSPDACFGAPATVVAFGGRGSLVAPCSGQKFEANSCRPFAPTAEPELCVVAKTVIGVVSGLGLHS